MRNRFHFFIVFAFCTTGLINCSIYQSSGRKTFESKADGTVRTQVGTSLSDNCWVQNSNETLPDIETNKKYTIDLLEGNEILICSEDKN